ncbi:MAG: hypothetical protein RML35_07965 [Chloroherpetonaceae bacterium]|nr:hypothetical protein [Chloroherpetonaceae bacterium]
MPKDSVSIERILEKLEKDERIGFDEGLKFLQEARKALGSERPSALIEATKALAARNPSLTTLNVERRHSSQSEKPNKPLVYLELPTEMKLLEVCQCVRTVAERASVCALWPQQVVRLAASEKLRVLKAAEKLAESGLRLVEGKLEGGLQDDAAVDEYFSAVMMLQKYGIKASVWLPLGASDEAKVRHLAQLREFQDRTQAFTFLFLHGEGKMERRNLLSTVALARVMLNNLKMIALSTYSLSQKVEETLLQECITLGVNQI